MSVDYTIDALIEQVQSDASVPRNQDVYGPAEFAALFNKCLELRIAPQVMKVREEHFVVEALYERSDFEELADGRLKLQIPPRVIGSRLKIMELLGADGTLVSEIPKLSPSNYQFFGYIFRGNSVILSKDAVQGSDQVRLQYFRRPSRLTARENVGQVVAIDTGTGSVTLDVLPEAFVEDFEVDLQSATEPFETLAEDLPILSVGGSSIMLTPTQAQLLSVGDFVCPSETAVIPQIPVSLHPILVRYAAAKVLESVGRLDAADRIMTRELPELEQVLYDLLDDRDESSPKKIAPSNALWIGRTRWPRRNW